MNYNTERPQLAYRNHGRRPWKTGQTHRTKRQQVRGQKVEHTPNYALKMMGTTLQYYNFREKALGAIMEPEPTTQEKIKQVSRIYPADAERINQCADVILKRKSDFWEKAFNKQLDRILGASSPSEARAQIDNLEYTIMEHPLSSPFLGSRKSRRGMRIATSAAVAILFVGAIITSIVLNLYL